MSLPLPPLSPFPSLVLSLSDRYQREIERGRGREKHGGRERHEREETETERGGKERGGRGRSPQREGDDDEGGTAVREMTTGSEDLVSFF